MRQRDWPEKKWRDDVARRYGTRPWLVVPIYLLAKHEGEIPTLRLIGFATSPLGRVCAIFEDPLNHADASAEPVRQYEEVKK